MIRNVAVKIGLLSTLLALAVSAGISAIGLSSPLWGAVSGGLAALIASTLLLRPIQSILDEIKTMQERQYFLETQFHSGDDSSQSWKVSPLIRSA